MDHISDHFARLPLTFDAVYSGFLGSERQIDTVAAFIDHHRESKDGRALVLVDPVMGDDGKLYSTYTEQMQAGMRRLCEKADIITPNLTEACFLTGTPWRDTSEMDEAQAEHFAATLAQSMTVFGAKQIVLTGVPFGESIGTYVLDASDAQPKSCFYTVRRQPQSYPGTGDIFASVLLGALMRGDGLIPAARTAADFIHDVIGYSIACGEPTRDGVLLEPMLKELVGK
jgi:pyridoxine kinase